MHHLGSGRHRAELGVGRVGARTSSGELLEQVTRSVGLGARLELLCFYPVLILIGLRRDDDIADTAVANPASDTNEDDRLRREERDSALDMLGGSFHALSNLDMGHFDRRVAP